MRLEVTTFDTGCTDKDQATKVLEEAAEVFGAWQEVVRCEGRESTTCRLDMYPNKKQEDCQLFVCLANEIADVITAACNLALRMGVDVESALLRTAERNHQRGRC